MRRLLKKGWDLKYVGPCQKCYGRGCEDCHQIGIVGSIFDPHSSAHYFGAPPLDPHMTGAKCSIYTARGKMRLRAQGGGGEAELVFYPSQVFDMMRYFVTSVSRGLQTFEDVPEYGVEAKFSGPPIMALAALSKKGQITCTHRPTKKQAKAIKLLRDAGLLDEAELLKSALEHEVFRGDAKEAEKCRKAVGKIEPGTIFKRVGNNVVFTEQG